jgi:hypothetical protein
MEALRPFQVDAYRVRADVAGFIARRERLSEPGGLGEVNTAGEIGASGGELD